MLTLILLFSLFLLFPLLLVLNIQGQDSFPVELSYFLIILQASYVIFISKGKGSSLYKVYFVFVYIFFGIIPWLEYKFKISYWHAKLYAEDDRLILNIIILTLNIIILFFYTFFKNKYLSRVKSIQYYSLTQRDRVDTLKFSSSLIIVIIAILSVFITLYMKDFNFLKLVYRGLESDLVNNTVGTGLPRWVNTLVGSTARYYSIIAAIYIFYFVKKSYLLKSILLVAALISAFPLGIPRFAAAALYIPLLLLMFPILTKSRNFSFLLLFGIVYVFPLFNQFRWYKEGKEIQSTIDLSFFFEGHFDSYQSFLMVVSDGFITYGKQLLGVLFFYVPRGLWHDKPIGSGAQMAKEFNLSLENISANFYAEGFINFGLVGCYLFAFLLAFIMAKFDTKMWYRKPQKNEVNFFRPFYLILLGYLFFMLRGDLMSSVSFLISMLVPALLVIRILKPNILYTSKKVNS